MGPLEGLRVVELVDETGEWAGKLLADMGAEVVKVEPTEGAATRRQPIPFMHNNTSKKSVTRMPDLAEVDVVLTTDPTYEATNEELIVATITPFGAGPYEHYESNDLIQMAMGGIVASCGYDDHDVAPVRPGLDHSHHIAGWHAVIGILTALHHRHNTGKGQRIDIAIHDCVSVCTEFAATFWFYSRELVQRQTARHAMPIITPRSLYPARNGRYVNLTGLTPDAIDYFANWAEEAGVDLSPYKDEDGNLVPGPGLGDAVRAITAIMESDEIWLTGQSLGLTWGSVRRPEDWLDDPHAIARGFFQVIDGVKVPGPPFAFRNNPGRVTRPPLVGEHDTGL